MIEIDNETTLKIDAVLLQKIADVFTKKDIELIVCSDSHIRELNKEHRNIDKATDVLSFPYDDMLMAPLGSIVISYEHVQLKAKELGHTNNEEFVLLFIHGLLHLLGFDHEIDNGEMRDKEAELIEMFSLPKSLIIRTEG